jgi:Zn-dependent protease with chaperone function
MLKAHGLYGHIRRNILMSRLLIASFFLATCVSWVLVNVSYNVTFRYIVGEDMHGGMFSGGTFSNTTTSRSRQGGSPSPEQPQLTRADLAVTGATFALWTLYIPVAFVTGWLALFLGANDKVMAWAMGGRPISRREEPRLYNIIENLSIQTGMPMPNVEIIECPALNAYAYGLEPEHATIGVTRGLLDSLNQAELEATIAHEFTHIQNHDSMVMAVATVFVGIFEYMMRYFLSGITGAHEKNMTPTARMARFLMIAWLAVPLFGSLVLSFFFCLVPAALARASLSRSREFLADAGAVELTKDADALVHALAKINGCDAVLDIDPTMQAMMISGRAGQWLATHPPVEERIAALRVYAGARVAAPRQSMQKTAAMRNAARTTFGQRTQKVGGEH